MQLEGQKYPYISSLSLHFLLVFKDSITPPTGLSVSPPAHADFLPFESIHHVILWLIILIKICFLVIDTKLLQVCTSCSYSSVVFYRRWKYCCFFFLNWFGVLFSIQHTTEIKRVLIIVCYTGLMYFFWKLELMEPVDSMASCLIN